MGERDVFWPVMFFVVFAVVVIAIIIMLYPDNPEVITPVQDWALKPYCNPAYNVGWFYASSSYRAMGIRMTDDEYTELCLEGPAR